MIHLNSIKVKEIIKMKELTIREKEVTCIVGQSGSGKSILLRLLNH